MHLTVLSASDVATASSSLTPNFLMSLMALVFVRLSSNAHIEMPHRTTVGTDSYSALFMPAHMDDFGTSMKVVSLPKGPSQEGLPASTLLLDERTGALKALINARSLTALRNAAGSALATRLVGPTMPHVLLAFGAGKQIEAHVELFIKAFPSLKRCIVVNRRPNERVDNLQASLQGQHPNVEITTEYAVDGVGAGTFDLQRAVLSADIICTATPSKTPLFRSDWVKVGTHLNLIGSFTPEMVEVDASLVQRAGKILVESRDACLKEAGELIQAEVKPGDLVEIGEIVELDGKPIRDEAMKIKRAGDVTIFKSVGVGLQDTAIAKAVFDKATSLNLGTKIEGYD